MWSSNDSFESILAFCECLSVVDVINYVFSSIVFPYSPQMHLFGRI